MDHSMFTDAEFRLDDHRYVLADWLGVLDRLLLGRVLVPGVEDQAEGLDEGGLAHLVGARHHHQPGVGDVQGLLGDALVVLDVDAMQFHDVSWRDGWTDVGLVRWDGAKGVAWAGNMRRSGGSQCWKCWDGSCQEGPGGSDGAVG